MTLKYESEILFDLMKRDGDDTPSDVLPYESELKEKYLEQVEGAYPKLQDYRSEWLNYNLNAHLPAEFPVETLSNVTNATVDNVVPYAYRSAILKGQTLINLFEEVDRETVVNESYQIFKIVGNQLQTLKGNTQYTLIFDKYIDGISTIIYKTHSSTLINEGYQAGQKILFTTISEVGTEFHVFIKGNTLQVAQQMLELQPKIIILEGDYTNQDIPFFEGMQSVKLPVLTTTGKNLFDGNLEYGSFNWSTGLKSESSSIIRSVNPIKINSSNICFTSATGDIKDAQYVFQYDKSMNFIGFVTNVNGEISLDTNTKYIHIRTQTNEGNGYVLRELDDYQFQIEEGKTKTTYEPFKSNILTVNEEVKLRGIGEVKDELDLLTGELTQYIGEVVFDGSDDENWSINYQDNSELITFVIKDIPNIIGHGFDVSYRYTLNNKFNNIKDYKNNECLLTHNDISALNNWLVVTIKRSKLSSQDVKGFKEYLGNNPVIFNYVLLEAFIKTVDLTVIDQDGNTLSRIKPIEGTMHLSTSGTPIQPTFNGEIPVEATYQNLASFIEE